MEKGIDKIFLQKGTYILWDLAYYFITWNWGQWKKAAMTSYYHQCFLSFHVCWQFTFPHDGPLATVSQTLQQLSEHISILMCSRFKTDNCAHCNYCHYHISSSSSSSIAFLWLPQWKLSLCQLVFIFLY